MRRSVAYGKQVLVGHGGLNQYLIVVDSVKRQGKLPGKAMSKNMLQWYTKRLVCEGIIKRIGYGVWQLNEQKWDDFQALKQVLVGHDGSPPMTKQTNTFHTQSRGVRGHGFQFVLKIPLLKNWDRREEFLKARQIRFKPAGSFRQGQSIMIGGFKVWLCQKSIIIYFPEGMDILEETARISKEMAFLKALEVIREVEEVLEVNFKHAGHYQLRLVKQHYADPNNSLAKKYEAEGKKLQVIGSDGKTWLLIDCSTGLPELETVHPSQAAGDMDDVVKRFFGEMKTNPVFPKETMEMFGAQALINTQFIANFKQVMDVLMQLRGLK
jgi:hypothetical protein